MLQPRNPLNQEILISQYVEVQTQIVILVQFQIVLTIHVYTCMGGWLRLVGSIKVQVSFAKEPYKGNYILQKRSIILLILLTVATPYWISCLQYMCKGVSLCENALRVCAYVHIYTLYIYVHERIFGYMYWILYLQYMCTHASLCEDALRVCAYVYIWTWIHFAILL